MANGIKYQSHEILNKVLNTAETGLQVDIVAGAEYAEDSGHSSTDTGNFVLGVRNDTLAALGGTDGDYVPFQMNASGALFVEVASASGDDSIYVDDADWTDSTSKHTLVGGLYQSSPQSITDGDTGPLQVNANGNLIIDVVNGGVLEGLVDGIETLLGTIDSDTDAIKTSLDNIDNSVDGNFLNVNMNLAGSDAQAGEGTISATTQRVTLATDDDGVAHLATIAGAVSTQMQVDVVASLPAGTNNIGDVDVLSVIPSTGATNLGKAIQSAQGGTDTGVAALVVRNDVLADLSGADGDYAPLQVDKSGALYTIEETGQLGSLFEDGTEDITSKQIIAIQFLEDTTFTTLTPSGSSLYIGTANQDGDAITTGNVFPQGMTIFGRWTGYRLASGTIIAYKGTF